MSSDVCGFVALEPRGRQMQKLLTFAVLVLAACTTFFIAVHVWQYFECRAEREEAYARCTAFAHGRQIPPLLVESALCRQTADTCRLFE